MNTKPQSTFQSSAAPLCRIGGIRHSAFTAIGTAVLATIAFFSATASVSAQRYWGTALSFDGLNDYVQAGSVPLANSSFTLEAWARRDTTGTMDMIVAQGTGATGRGLMFGYHWYGFVFDFYGEGVSTTNIDNVWHHWAGTYNATNKLRCLYRDGVLMDSNFATQDFLGSGPLRIGGEPFGDPASFAGVIDDVRVWNVARSQTEIQQNLSQPLSGSEPNLLAYWKFDEGDGTNAFDATASGFNGVLVNGPSWTNSMGPQYPTDLGTAMLFDGTRNDVDLGTNGPVLGTNFTEEAWIYPQITDMNWHGLLGNQLAGGDKSRSPSVLIYGPTAVQVGFGTGTGWTNYVASNVLRTNSWNHIAATYDGVTYRLYVNGGLVLATNCTAVPCTTPVRYIGTVDTFYWFPGRVDELRIWSKARSQVQIQANMNHPLTGSESNLVAYYRFNEQAGVMAYDATANHRDGTLINRPLRAPATWRPEVALNSGDPFTNECHVPFADPTTVNARVVAFSAGGQSLALRADGTVAGWVGNQVPASATNIVATSAGGDHSLALRANGTVIAWGDNWAGQTNVPAGASNGVAAVAASGAGHSLALKTDGTVVGWGNSWVWQSEPPSGLANVVAVAAGVIHSLALRSDGTVVGWGYNLNGEATGVPTPYSWPPYGGGTVKVGGLVLSNVVAIAAGESHSLALKADGTVLGWGAAGSGQTTPPANATNVVAIAAGAYHSLALKADGTVIGWGSGGGLIPSTATNVVAIAAYGYSDLALRADGTIIGWFAGTDIGTDIPASAYQINQPLTVTGTVNANVLGTYTVSYSTTNALNAPASASRTVIVVDTLPPVLTLRGSNPLMVNRDAIFVDPGATATDLCGGDWTGNVISNITVNTSIPGIYTNTFTAIDASGNTGIATRTVIVGAPIVVTLPATNVINDVATLVGTVNPNAAETAAWFEWRSVYEPEYACTMPPQNVGSGTAAVTVSADLSGLTPGLVYRYRLAASNSPWVARGVEQSFWAPTVNLHGPAFQTLPLGTPFPDPTTVEASPLAVAAGTSHTLVLRADGRVVGWGANGWGQITVPANATNVVAIAAGGSHSLALKADGRVVGWGANYYDQITIPANATSVVAIAAGENSSFALRADGSLAAWGDWWHGQTNIPANATNVVAIAAGSYHNLALKGDGRVVGWGSSWSDAPANATNVIAIAAGSYHSLALKADGTVVGWGDNNAGQTNVPANATNVVAIAAGGYHNLALKADGTVVGWGNNDCGQTTIPADATNVVAIAAGGFYDVEFYNIYGHSLALRADGTLIGWGDNSDGQISVPAGLNILSNLALRVVGAVNPNVLGTYVLNYSTTNALGAVGTAARIVVIATPPIVTTEPVTGVGPVQATLQGTVNPRASQTWAWFEYGLGANYERQTPPLPVGNATNAQVARSQLTGLLPWMTYHYRTVATNSLGRIDGPDRSFTLPGPSMAAPSLSALPNITLAQGGSTSLWFTVSPAAVDVRVRADNAVLLPTAGLALGGSGNTRSLSLLPAPTHSGAAQVTVTASDGTRAATGTFTVTITPSAEYHSEFLSLGDTRMVSTNAWQFRVVDTGTGSTNYTVEYLPDLSPTNHWTTATNVTARAGHVFEVATGPPQKRTGYYRVKGFRVLSGSFSSSDFTGEEGESAGVVLVFNGPFNGLVSYAWTDEQGTTWTSQVQVNGTTAVIPVPVADDASIGQLRHLTLRLEPGPAYALSGTLESTLTIEENDAQWLGVMATANGSLGFELTLVRTNGLLCGLVKSAGSGFFPTNVLTQVTFADNSFTAVAADVPLPALTGSPLFNAPSYVDLRLDAANAPGQTNVSSTRVQGTATLVSRLPGQPHLDSAAFGTFLLLRSDTAPSTNQVPLSPVP